MTAINPFHILIIEDNEADQELMSYLFSHCPIPCELRFASNGVEGSDRAFRRGPYAKEHIPDLILMDLNLPRKDGRELIREFKADKELCRIPIIMISTSSSLREVADVYCLGANAFISKPVDLDRFQETINGLTAFWLRCVLLPTRLAQGIPPSIS